MLAYNRAALDAYGEFGVEKVLAYDGDYDPECEERNGQEFTVEEALAIEDHPNGTLDWAPVTDKAYHEEPLAMAIKGLAAAVDRPLPSIIVQNGDGPAMSIDPSPLTEAFMDVVAEIRQANSPRTMKVVRDERGKIVGAEQVVE